VLTETGATQVLPGWIVKVEPTGNWSLVAKLLVAPTVPAGWLAVSFKASMMVISAVVTLFAGTVSLVAPVVPVTVTSIGVVSVPPSVPGITTVIGQVKVAPFGKLAAVPALATQAPVVTVEPLLPLATQVAVVAAAGPLLVQTKLPLTLAPGAAVVGKPLMTGCMSAFTATLVTVKVAVSHWVAFGAGAQTW
jgi:hypothetical protein